MCKHFVEFLRECVMHWKQVERRYQSPVFVMDGLNLQKKKKSIQKNLV
jgi:hypothetical protein